MYLRFVLESNCESFMGKAVVSLYCLMLFCFHDIQAQEAITPSNSLITTVDSLEQMFKSGEWREGPASTSSIYPQFWYKRNEQSNVLCIQTSGMACVPRLFFFKLGDQTLWVEINVAEVDNRSMLPPVKSWIYHIKGRKILSGTTYMENMYRPWTCNVEIAEKEINEFIDKFYLYKSELK